MSAKDQWVRQRLLSLNQPVVSFIYDGTPSEHLMPGWMMAPLETKMLSNGQTRYMMKWTDPATGLEVRVVAVDYSDYPAVEWTAYIRNGGARETPILEQVRAINSGFRRGTAQVPGLDPNGGSPIREAVLRTTQGDNFSAGSYEPLEFRLNELAKSFQPAGGRPTNGAWPFFNIDYGREGVILALGWPGQWQAQFMIEKDLVSAVAGQETTHLRLRPGEEIRTPLVALLFWKGEDWIAGQNLWRRWFLAHNIPRPNGRLPELITAGSNDGPHKVATEEMKSIDAYIRQGEGARMGYWWIDSGWYEGSDWWTDWWSAKGIGTWKPDPVRFPRGIREVSDYVHGRGMKLVLWFEPERVYRGSYLWENHPEWLLKWNADEIDSEGEALDLKDNNRLLNLGNPAARQWLTDYISRFITDQGVDIYRQDFNVDPLKAWQINDGPDRQGMTENLYVQGYLAFWDALLQQHPGMLIDSCASGGRRNDLETLRRSVVLYRSDYQAPSLSVLPMSTDVFDGNQGHTYGMSLWVPYSGTGEYCEDAYSARSHLCPSVSVGTHLANPDWASLRRQISDHRSVADLFYGDYYPLTPYSRSEEVWMAWEFTRPTQGDGMVQAFRRENSPDAGIDLKLRGLKSDANYEVTDLDSGRKIRSSGKSLMREGLRVAAAAPRTALIITFREIP